MATEFHSSKSGLKDELDVQLEKVEWISRKDAVLKDLLNPPSDSKLINSLRVKRLFDLNNSPFSDTSDVKKLFSALKGYEKVWQQECARYCLGRLSVLLNSIWSFYPAPQNKLLGTAQDLEETIARLSHNIKASETIDWDQFSKDVKTVLHNNFNNNNIPYEKLQRLYKQPQLTQLKRISEHNGFKVHDSKEFVTIHEKASDKSQYSKKKKALTARAAYEPPSKREQSNGKEETKRSLETAENGRDLERRVKSQEKELDKNLHQVKEYNPNSEIFVPNSVAGYSYLNGNRFFYRKIHMEILQEMVPI